MKKNLVDTRFLALDALRLVLAFWVLYHHLAGTGFAFRTSHESGILEWISFALYKTGNFAPQAFFVISGFVISGYLREQKDNSRKFSHFYWNFLRTRFLTLYPLYLLSLIAIFVNSNEGQEYFLWQLFGLNAFNRNYCVLNCPAWSLSAEFFFYLLAPLLYALLDRIRLILQKILFVAIIAIQSWLSIAIQQNSSPENAWYFLYHFPPYLLLSFIIGFIGFNIGIHNLLSKMGMSSIIRFFALFAIWTSYIYLFVQYPRFLSAATFTIIPAAISLLFIGKSSESNRSTLLPSKFLFLVSKVARATYPIYILQWTYIGALRLIFNVETLWLFNLLFIIFAIPITFTGLKIDNFFRSLIDFNEKGSIKASRVPILGILAVVISLITTMFPNKYTATNFAPKSILVTEIKSISISEDPEENQRINFTIAVLNESKSNARTSFCMIFMKDFEATLTNFEIEGLIPPRARGTFERTLEITKDVKLSSNPERWIARCF